MIKQTSHRQLPHNSIRVDSGTLQKNVVLVGGSGFWSDQNYIKNLLEIKQKRLIKVTAIIDPQNPYESQRHHNLKAILAMDNPQWVNPSEFSTIDEIFAQLKEPPALVIVSCNPDRHFSYIQHCISNDIHTLIDKPVCVTSGAAANLDNAKQIYNDFLHLINKKELSGGTSMALTVLRRRSLKPFMHVADEVARCYRETGQGITQINLIVNGGIHKFPKEFYFNTGAHGYLEGIGSLSHSAYHYIDIITWLLEQAPGDLAYLRIGLNSVKRISDYLNSNGYSSLQKLLDIPEEIATAPGVIPQQILDAELDTNFTLEMLNSEHAVIGAINFIDCHTTFSPRTRGVELNGDHANYTDGGRMSHIYLDVQQGPLQSWQVDKNDIVFSTQSIRVSGRRHPSYHSETTYSQIYTDAYEKAERPMAQLLDEVIAKLDSPGNDQSIPGSYIKDLNLELFNMRLYSAFYELLAMEKTGEHKKLEVDINELFSLHPQASFGLHLNT